MAASWVVFSSGFMNDGSVFPNPFPVCVTSSEDTANHVLGALRVVFPKLSHATRSEFSTDQIDSFRSQIEKVVRGDLSSQHLKVVNTALDILQRYPHLPYPDESS